MGEPTFSTVQKVLGYFGPEPAKQPLEGPRKKPADVPNIIVFSDVMDYSAIPYIKSKNSLLLDFKVLVYGHVKRGMSFRI